MLSHWLIAIKPPALIKILMPVLVGLSLGVAQAGWQNFGMFGVVVLLAVLAQLYIVLLNDYADAEADRQHGEEFPELLDPRVIPGGLISRRRILWAGLLAVVALLSVGLLLSIKFNRPNAFFLLIAGMLVFFMYSFPPFKLNYRGGGEALEAFGVGILLPIIAFYIYTGELPGEVLGRILPTAFFAATSALASGLKHEPADRVTGKRTFAVLFGGASTGKFILVLQAVSILTCLGYVIFGVHHVVLLVFGVLIPAWMRRKMLGAVEQANYRHLTALKDFKNALANASNATNVGLILSVLAGAL